MISVAEAKALVAANSFTLAPQTMPLEKAAGFTLANDVYSPIDMPSFDQSSMDGYAFLFSGWQSNKTLEITGLSAAGSPETLKCLPQQAVRIFTGAAVPPGADTVVMQEKVTVENGQLIINDAQLEQGINVRPKGTDIKTGEIALSKGAILSPAAIGFLAGLGITNINVYPKAKVRLIVTGKELQTPGKRLSHGQVYESNSYTIKAALGQLGIYDVQVDSADDDPAIITSVLQSALANADVVLLTGGVSVGDYDFVLEAAKNCGVETIFHKIKQRPGKPLFFGKKDKVLVFGLPGNPSSVLSCFYHYVTPALQKMSSSQNPVTVLRATLGKTFRKAAGLTHFLKGHYDGKIATPLGAQESYRLSSFAQSNCLIQIDENVTLCNEGEPVDIHFLPI